MSKVNLFDCSKESLSNLKIFGVNKPLNWTSNDVVSCIKSFFKFKKVGHGGTLDPLATGVLIIGVEEGTKLLTSNLAEQKQYEFTIQLGMLTKSYDLGTEVIENKPWNKTLTINDIKKVCDQFVNSTYMQVPPAFSAKKINGVKAYELARNDKKVELKPSHVILKKYEILDFDIEKGHISFLVDVSKGFYIRSFAYDLGIKLNTYATIIKLNRTKSGNFCLNDCFLFEKKSKNK